MTRTHRSWSETNAHIHSPVVVTVSGSVGQWYRQGSYRAANGAMPVRNPETGTGTRRRIEVPAGDLAGGQPAGGLWRNEREYPQLIYIGEVTRLPSGTIA